MKKREYTSAVAPFFVLKYCCSVFLQKNGSLGEFHSLLLVHWVCYRFVTVTEIAYGEDYGLELGSGNVLWKVTGKTETDGGVRPNQPIDSS